eukprot:Gb_32292 [translate_table: standard]
MIDDDDGASTRGTNLRKRRKPEREILALGENLLERGEHPGGERREGQEERCEEGRVNMRRVEQNMRRVEQRVEGDSRHKGTKEKHRIEKEECLNDEELELGETLAEATRGRLSGGLLLSKEICRFDTHTHKHEFGLPGYMPCSFVVGGTTSNTNVPSVGSKATFWLFQGRVVASYIHVNIGDVHPLVMDEGDLPTMRGLGMLIKDNDKSLDEDDIIEVEVVAMPSTLDTTRLESESTTTHICTFVK